MPYFAPEAPIPMTSWAPRFAEMKAKPVIQAAMDLPDRKKSVLVFIKRFSVKPTPITNRKYMVRMVQSTPCNVNLGAI